MAWVVVVAPVPGHRQVERRQVDGRTKAPQTKMLDEGRNCAFGRGQDDVALGDDQGRDQERRHSAGDGAGETVLGQCVVDAR